MSDIANALPHTADSGKALLTAWRNFVSRLHESRLRNECRRRPLRGTDAEIRRQAARDVPAYMCRDLGLDPDVL